jgi:hypothetical protein
MSAAKFAKFATVAALRAVEESGCNPAYDVENLSSGAQTRDQLLALCLDGADVDRIEGWLDYVSAVCAAAEAQS